MKSATMLNKAMQPTLVPRAADGGVRRFMSRHRKQIRGDNRLSNTLNKPIGGQLGKKRSRVFVVTFGIVALLAFWWLFTSQLGIKAGSGATVFLVVALLAVTWQHKVLHSRKRKWKAFDREK